MVTHAAFHFEKQHHSVRCMNSPSIIHSTLGIPAMSQNLFLMCYHCCWLYGKLLYLVYCLTKAAVAGVKMGMLFPSQSLLGYS